MNTNGSSLKPNNFIFFDGGGLRGWDAVRALGPGQQRSLPTAPFSLPALPSPRCAAQASAHAGSAGLQALPAGGNTHAQRQLIGTDLDCVGGQPHPQQGRLWDPSQSARRGELERGAQAEPGFLPTHAIFLISITL